MVNDKAKTIQTNTNMHTTGCVKILKICSTTGASTTTFQTHQGIPLIINIGLIIIKMPFVPYAL